MTLSVISCNSSPLSPSILFFDNECGMLQPGVAFADITSHHPIASKRQASILNIMQQIYMPMYGFKKQKMVRTMISKSKTDYQFDMIFL